jgi:anti-anti-sigma regulatory factor
VTDPDKKVVVVDVSALTRPDLATIDVLARLTLAARRAGTRLQLRDACGPLRDLVALSGLGNVVELEPELRLELQRKAEEAIQIGLEEMGDVGDQPA